MVQGFYYDAFYGDLGLNEDHFKQIEAQAAKAASVLPFYQLKLPFVEIEVIELRLTFFSP